jgi:soluble lytic murein transglycosylase
MHFSRDEKVAIAREIGLTLARRFDSRALDVMTKYDPELRDNTVSEWRLRLLLRLARWDDAYQLTRRLPQDLATTNRWRYWQARSLELAQPQNPKRRRCTKPSPANATSMVSSPPIVRKSPYHWSTNRWC